MDYNQGNIPENEGRILFPIAFVLGSITWICLLMRVIVQFLSPVFESKAMKLQFNLCLARFVSMTMVIPGIGITRAMSPGACIFLVVADHYALIATFFLD